MLYTAHEFQERVIATLAARPGHALVWGVSPVTIYLLAELQRLGLEQHVAGVADHRPGQCGRRIAQVTRQRLSSYAHASIPGAVLHL